jgi:glyoxylase-like metal-dependent hydrolase (beta-lactamase superfamily II)
VIFEQIATGGCQSYLLGCADTCAGVLIDPEVSQIDRYLALAAREGLRVRFVIDTHTHADHFSASCRIADKLGAMTVMHRASPAPGVAMRVDDGESIVRCCTPRATPPIRCAWSAATASSPATRC